MYLNRYFGLPYMKMGIKNRLVSTISSRFSRIHPKKNILPKHYTFTSVDNQHYQSPSSIILVCTNTFPFI